ncbi:MAG: hypothetical protein DMD36_10375 [Gemmatimonadetes bacterium]|nr:MAG: hypothetical protein DMD36_10375 [Gemmatimonadota bacterium]
MLNHLDDLSGLGEAGLRDLWERGVAPAAEELAGWVFRGWNTSNLAARSPVGGRAFAKAFFRDAEAVHGCNFVVGTRHGEWEIDTRHPFGFFAVYPTTESRAWGRHRAALLLDYGRGRGAEFLAAWGARPSVRLRVVERLARPLRDLIRRPPNAADGLYVGRAFVTSTLKLPVTCFALERWGRMTPEPVGSREPARAGDRKKKGERIT